MSTTLGEADGGGAKEVRVFLNLRTVAHQGNYSCLMTCSS